MQVMAHTEPYEWDEWWFAEPDEPDPDDWDTAIDQQDEMYAHGAYEEDGQ